MSEIQTAKIQTVWKWDTIELSEIQTTVEHRNPNSSIFWCSKKSVPFPNSPDFRHCLKSSKSVPILDTFERLKSELEVGQMGHFCPDFRQCLKLGRKSSDFRQCLISGDQFVPILALYCKADFRHSLYYSQRPKSERSDFSQR